MKFPNYHHSYQNVATWVTMIFLSSVRYATRTYMRTLIQKSYKYSSLLCI